MYLFLAFKTEEELRYLRDKVDAIGRTLNISSVVYYFPFHISLKISFKIEDEMLEDIVKTIEEYISTIKPFKTYPKRIEISKNIVWIRMKPSLHLRKIHNDLNNLLLSKYNIPLHEYDNNYKFHVTLFLDDDISKIKEASKDIKDIQLPKKLYLNKVLIGTSPDGFIGTYRVFKEYDLK